MIHRFDILLTPDLHDGGYTVTVPASPGTVTGGRTVDEALINDREAIYCHTDGSTADELAESRARVDVIVVSMKSDTPRRETHFA